MGISKAVIIILLICVNMLSVSSLSWGEDKIYTNADLKPEPRTYSNYTPLEPLVKGSDFNHSFAELRRYIENKVANIKNPEYKIYLHPLLPGMTKEQVKQIWSEARVRSGFHEENEAKTWSVDTADYEIGVSLFFSNNKLNGWRVYNPPPPSNAPKNSNVIDYKDLMKGKSGSEPQKEIHVFGENEEVNVSIKGCQTLQEAIDGKAGATDAVIAVLGHGRTIEEICDSVGRGCKSCVEAPRQMGSNQRR